MSELELHYILLAAVMTLVGKIIWDWLTNLKANGHEEKIITLLEEINERQIRIRDDQLKGR